MTTVAREYLRSSKGRGGRSVSTDDQHADNVKAEQEYGPWTWGEAYADTGLASKYAKKTRDDFDRLMVDLQSKEFGEPGTVLVLWEVSRLARETGKGVALVDAVELGGYQIHVTSLDRTFNPSNYGDRHSLISGINDAEKEARLLSARTLRGVNSALDDGKPHGKIPFGYKRDHELIDGRHRAVRQYPDPVEAPLVQELFRRVLGGPGAAPESMRAISLDWERRGIVSREKGVPFSGANLRKILTRKAYIGIRVHGGSERPGNWPALIESETFEAVQRLLADPTRRTHTTSAVRHVLTGTLRCDVCGNGMTVTPGDRPKKQGVGHHGHSAYICRRYGCLRIDKAETDAYLIGDAEHPGVILAYLSRSDVAEGLASTGDDSKLSAVRVELANKRADLKEFEEAEPARTLAESRERARSVEALEAEIKELEGRERSLTAPDPLSTMFKTGPGAAERWQRTDITQQRAIAALLLTPELLGQPRVQRVADSASESAIDRIKWATEVN